MLLKEFVTYFFIFRAMDDPLTFWKKQSVASWNVGNVSQIYRTADFSLLKHENHKDKLNGPLLHYIDFKNQSITTTKNMDNTKQLGTAENLGKFYYIN